MACTGPLIRTIVSPNQWFLEKPHPRVRFFMCAFPMTGSMQEGLANGYSDIMAALALKAWSTWFPRKGPFFADLADFGGRKRDGRQ